MNGKIISTITLISLLTSAYAYADTNYKPQTLKKGESHAYTVGLSGCTSRAEICQNYTPVGCQFELHGGNSAVMGVDPVNGFSKSNTNAYHSKTLTITSKSPADKEYYFNPVITYQTAPSAYTGDSAEIKFTYKKGSASSVTLNCYAQT